MDSLIFELQIVFYFQLFLSANVRHTTKQGRIRYNICRKDKTDRYKCRCLMNVGMPASIIRMPFLSKNFNFLEKVSI